MAGRAVCEVQFSGHRLYAFTFGAQDSIYVHYIDQAEHAWHVAPILFPSEQPQPVTRRNLALKCTLLPDLPYLIVTVEDLDRTSYWGYVDDSKQVYMIDKQTHRVTMGAWPPFTSASWSPRQDMITICTYARYKVLADSSAVWYTPLSAIDARSGTVIRNERIVNVEIDVSRSINPVCINATDVVAVRGGLLNISGGMFTTTTSAVSNALVCLASPTVLVGLATDRQTLLRYNVATGASFPIDTLPSDCIGLHATYDRPSHRMAVVYRRRDVTGYGLITHTRLYSVQDTTASDTLVVMKSARSVKLFDSITVQVFPLIRQGIGDLAVIVRDTLRSCASGLFSICGTKCELNAFSISGTVDRISRTWSDSSMAYEIRKPSGVADVIRPHPSTVFDLQLSPQSSMLGIGQAEAVSIYAVRDAPTATVGGRLWNAARNGAVCFGAYEGGECAYIASGEIGPKYGYRPPELTIAVLGLPSLAEQQIVWTANHAYQLLLPPPNTVNVSIPHYNDATGELTVFESIRINGLSNPPWPQTSCFHKWTCASGSIGDADVKLSPDIISKQKRCLHIDHFTDSTFLFSTTETVGIASLKTGAVRSIFSAQSSYNNVLVCIALDDFNVITTEGIYRWDGKWYHPTTFPFRDGISVFRLGDEYTCVLRMRNDTLGCIVRNATGAIVEWLGEGFVSPRCGVYNPNLGELYIGDVNGTVSTVVPSTPLPRVPAARPDRTVPSPVTIALQTAASAPSRDALAVDRANGLSILASFDLASILYFDASGALLHEQSSFTLKADSQRLNTSVLPNGIICVLFKGREGGMERMYIQLF